MARPTLAVWKFASCDGCQLSLLDCEDELLAVADAVDIAQFAEATSHAAPGPYDLSLVEGSITTPHDAERIREIRAQSKTLVTIGACATAGGIQALRNFRDHAEMMAVVYARPEYIDVARDVDADRRARGGRLRAARVPDRQAPAARGDLGVPARAPAERAEPLDVHRVQDARHGVRDGRARAAVPRPGDARRLRRAVPELRARLLRVLRPERRAADRAAGRAPDRARGDAARGRAAVRDVQRGGARRSARRASAMTTRTIEVDVLARVEGEGALTLVLDGEAVVEAKLRLFEPPRLFEALMRGRACTEAPDITARICGICPVAYQMSACHAVEDALGVRVDGALRELRRLLYCGEWIESHVLHMVMLHAPDFLGCPDAMTIAKLHPERVRAGLRVKKAGNAIVRRARRARDPPGQRQGRRVLPRAAAERARRAAAGAARRARGRRGDARLARDVRVPGVRARLRAGVAPAPGRVPDERGPPGVDEGARHRRARLRRPHRTRSRCRTRRRCTRGSPGAGRTSAGRSRGSRTTRIGCRRAPPPPPRGSGSSRRAGTRTACCSRAGSRRSTRSTRRSGSSRATRRPPRPRCRW